MWVEERKLGLKNLEKNDYEHKQVVFLAETNRESALIDLLGKEGEKVEAEICWDDGFNAYLRIMQKEK